MPVVLLTWLATAPKVESSCNWNRIMKKFPRLSNSETEHRRLVLGLKWRYGPKAWWVAWRAHQDTEAGVFKSPAEAITRYNDHYDTLHAKKEESSVN